MWSFSFAWNPREFNKILFTLVLWIHFRACVFCFTVVVTVTWVKNVCTSATPCLTRQTPYLCYNSKRKQRLDVITGVYFTNRSQNPAIVFGSMAVLNSMKAQECAWQSPEVRWSINGGSCPDILVLPVHKMAKNRTSQSMLMKDSASRTWLLLCSQLNDGYNCLTEWLPRVRTRHFMCTVCFFSECATVPGRRWRIHFHFSNLCVTVCVCACVCLFVWVCFGLCDSAVVKDDGCIWQVSRWWMAGISLVETQQAARLQSVTCNSKNNTTGVYRNSTRVMIWIKIQ